jgi:hypothetical protein
MATSASPSSWSGVPARPSRAMAMPTLAPTPTSRPAATGHRSTMGSLRAATRRAAISVALCSAGRSSHTTMNSSPASRPRVSAGRSRSATVRRTSSPASWPRESLIGLNRSRSTKSTASGSVVRSRRRSPWWSRSRMSARLGAAGEEVVAGLVGETVAGRLGLGRRVVDGVGDEVQLVAVVDRHPPIQVAAGHRLQHGHHVSVHLGRFRPRLSNRPVQASRREVSQAPATTRAVPTRATGATRSPRKTTPSAIATTGMK